MTTVGVVLVTRNAQRWLPELLASVQAQTQAPERIVVIDDGSTDATQQILRELGIEAIPAATSSRDVTTRIARNFLQGVRACADLDVIALGDHDDVWHPDRIARQVALLEADPTALMVASDGTVVDAEGRAAGRTLRATFPVDADWAVWSNADRMRFALSHSVSTGGASMLRPSAFPSIDVPDGWLHDRWWSLVATARGGMLIDREPVIDYRVQSGQQVGLDAAAQGSGSARRLGRLVRHGSHSARKYRDVRFRLRSLALDADVAEQVNVRNIIAT